MDTRVRRRRVLVISLAALLLLLPIVAGCAARVPFGGTVRYQMDGAPAATTVDAVADGASVSGTLVMELGQGTHTVQLACASRIGDVWAIGGRVKESTVTGEHAGPWSAFAIKDGSPQHMFSWLSVDPVPTEDCDDFLASILSMDFTLDYPVSGAMVPPPESALSPSQSR